MGLEQIIPAIFLIAVLILIIPGFLETNSNYKRFIWNLFLWSIVVVIIVIISYLIIR